jgi:hypothetical protein
MPAFAGMTADGVVSLVLLDGPWGAQRSLGLLPPALDQRVAMTIVARGNADGANLND